MCGGVGVRLPHTIKAISARPAASQKRCTAGATRDSAMLGAVAGVADHVGAGGRRESKRVVAQGWVALQVVQLDAGQAAQVVPELHHRYVRALEAELHA